jgi:large subunit ribosomal protein L13
MQKTFMQKKETVEREWFVIDAEGQTLGRLSTKVANVLRGKHKPTYTPHVDCGDYVIVINASKIKLTGKKWSDKIYYRHTGHPGGLKSISAKDLMEKDETALVTKSIKGMVPKNALGRQILKKLTVVANAEHPHVAQQPKEME